MHSEKYYGPSLDYRSYNSIFSDPDEAFLKRKLSVVRIVYIIGNGFPYLSSSAEEMEMLLFLLLQVFGQVTADPARE